MPLPAETIEPLSLAIARAFDVADLERVMLKTTGEGLFQVWVAPGLPLQQTTFALLQRVDARGLERIVLAEMRARRADNAALTDLIDRACPDAQLALPATGQQVAVLITGLDAVRARMDDPGVRDRLAQSVAKLEEIVQTIDSLHAYKALHECLHQLQAKQFRALKEAARNLPTQPDQAAELLAYRNQLRGACLIARQTVNDLPGTPVERATETMWIDVLDAAGDQFHDAIDAGDPQGARSALRKIRSIMATHPPRLNGLIFNTASELPLEDLMAALRDVGGEAVPEIAAALSSLRLIGAMIRAGVVEHREWQDADIRIAEIDQLLERDSPDQLEEFTTDWLELKAIVSDLAVRDPGARWAGKIQSYITNVDDGMSPEVAKGPYRLAFESFRGEAQFRFLMVDSKLKADCSALVRIGTPLHRILEEL